MSLGNFFRDRSPKATAKKSKFTPAATKRPVDNVSMWNEGERLVSPPRRKIAAKKSVILTGVDSYNN
jgi:hypothetical protein